MSIIIYVGKGRGNRLNESLNEHNKGRGLFNQLTAKNVRKVATGLTEAQAYALEKQIYDNHRPIENKISPPFPVPSLLNPDRSDYYVYVIED